MNVLELLRVPVVHKAYSVLDATGIVHLISVRGHKAALGQLE